MNPVITPVSPQVRRWITGALLVGTFLSSIEVMVVSPAMPAIVSDLGRAGLYAWVFSAYVLFQTITIPLYGIMADQFGRKPAYVTGVSLFVFGSLVCAQSMSIEVLVLGRIIQGAGAGALMALTMTIFGDLYAVAERTKMQGLFSLVWGVSSLLGPLAGGWLTETWSWRAIFWVNVLPGAIAGIIVTTLLPTWTKTKADPTQKAQKKRRLSRLLENRTQQAIHLSGPLHGAALMGIIGFLPVWIQAVDGGSPMDAGLAVIPMSLSWTIGANVCGRMVDQMGFRTLVRLGMALCAMGALICGIWTAHPIGLVIYGAGMGFSISSFNVAVQETAPNDLRGFATSFSLFSRSIGSAIGITVFGWVAGLEFTTEDFSQVQNLADGVSRVFWTVAFCVLAGASFVVARFPKELDEVSETTPQSQP